MQRAVNALFDSRSAAEVLPWYWPKRRRSLDEELRDAVVRLVHKTTDFSARGVVVPDAEVSPGRIGVPLFVILEVFAPLAARVLVRDGHTKNIRQAREQFTRDPLPANAWAAVLEVMQGRPLLVISDLQQIAVLRPVVVEGEALRVHPEDGVKLWLRYASDQLTLHVPVTDAAVAELNRGPEPAPCEDGCGLAGLTAELLVSAVLSGQSLPLGLLDRMALGVSGLLPEGVACAVFEPRPPRAVSDDRPLSVLHLSRRTQRCLARRGITTVGQLTERRPRELYDGWSFGLRCLEEVRERLAALGLRLRRDRLWC